MREDTEIPATSPQSPAPQPGRPLSPRAVTLGLLLVPVNSWWLTHIEYVRYSDNATTSAIFFHCLSVLLILVGISHLLQRVAPRRAFGRQEILTVYVILVVASALGGHDQLQILFTTIAWVCQNATPENKWADDIIPHVPRHLVVSDERTLGRLFRGDSSLYAPGNFGPWVEPLLWWSAFAMVFVWTLLCLMAVFRRQWDRERLNYPIASVPLEFTSARNNPLQSKLFWGAFGAAFCIQMLRLAHNLWPAVPTLNIGVYNYSFRGLPWSAAGTIPVSSYPFSYGLAYLLPLQLAFSVWFFMWLARVQLIVAAMLGFTQYRRFPFVQQQGVGAYFGVAFFVLWAAREHLSRALRQAFGGAKVTAADQQEPLPSTVAVWGFLGGVAFLMWFSLNAGMSLPTTVSFWAILLTTVLTLTRLRAELGLPTIELYQVGADDILQNLCGGKAFSRKDLSVMTLYFWLVRTHRQLPMPVQADALRIGEQSGLRLRSLSVVLLAAAVLAIISSFWAYLHVMYQVGFDQATFTGPAKWAFGAEPWRKLSQWVNAPRAADWGGNAAYLFGLGFTLALAALRTRFVWWPLHPVGYLVSGSFGLFRLWLPIFLTWLIKSLLLRYGGLGAYRKAQPLFMGLIAGEFAAAFLRTVLDLIFDLHLPASSGVGGL
jgi:hypothetical protein